MLNPLVIKSRGVFSKYFVHSYQDQKVLMPTTRLGTSENKKKINQKQTKQNKQSRTKQKQKQANQPTNKHTNKNRRSLGSNHELMYVSIWTSKYK